MGRMHMFCVSRCAPDETRWKTLFGSAEVIAFDECIAESSVSEGGNEEARLFGYKRIGQNALNYILNFITGSVSVFFGQSADCIVLQDTYLLDELPQQ